MALGFGCSCEFQLIPWTTSVSHHFEPTVETIVRLVFALRNRISPAVRNGFVPSLRREAKHYEDTGGNAEVFRPRNAAKGLTWLKCMWSRAWNAQGREAGMSLRPRRTACQVLGRHLAGYMLTTNTSWVRAIVLHVPAARIISSHLAWVWSLRPSNCFVGASGCTGCTPGRCQT